MGPKSTLGNAVLTAAVREDAKPTDERKCTIFAFVVFL